LHPLDDEITRSVLDVNIKTMKKIILALLCVSFLNSCSNKEVENRLITEKKGLESEIEKLAVRNKIYKTEISILKDSIRILKFSAPDRLFQIKKMIVKKDYSGALKKIELLKQTFPLSKETLLANQDEEFINKKIAEKKAKEERLKALGFKVFKDNYSGSVGNVSFAFSKFRFNRKFYFDYCPDVEEEYCTTSDKNNLYFLATLELSSKDNYASVPNLGLYTIVDGKLKNISYIKHEYESWTSYGAKLGNYSDNSHSFSKVDKIRYKIAGEITKEETKKPLFFLTKKKGYLGDRLTVEDVKKDYVVIKVVNRHKI